MDIRRRAVQLGFLLVALSNLALTSQADAQTQKFVGVLSSSSENPANGSAGMGRVEASLDSQTQVLHWHLTYSGLTGPATAAHFHGPAEIGQNAGVAIPLKVFSPSPVDGEATLTPAQASDLRAGKYYLNVHTAANPGGEIRAQLEPIP